MGRRSASPEQDVVQAAGGFTLVELLVAAVLMALVVGGTATIMLVSTRTSQRSGKQRLLESLINQDLAAIQDLNDRFTCCPGSCTATASTITAAVTSGSCATSTSGSQTYYSPVQASGSSSTAATTTFEAACSAGTIATALATEFPSVPTAPTGTSLNRSSVSQVDTAAHRLQWSYTAAVNGRTVINRVVNLVPVAAAWCP